MKGALGIVMLWSGTPNKKMLLIFPQFYRDSESRLGRKLQEDICKHFKNSEIYLGVWSWSENLTLLGEK